MITDKMNQTIDSSENIFQEFRSERNKQALNSHYVPFKHNAV